MPLQSLLLCVTKAEFVLTINQYKIKQTSDKNIETYQLEIISWSSVKFSELTPQELYGNINKNYLICDILRVKGLRPLTTSQNNKHTMNWWIYWLIIFYLINIFSWSIPDQHEHGDQWLLTSSSREPTLECFCKLLLLWRQFHQECFELSH